MKIPQEWIERAAVNNRIDPSAYQRYDVKRGLRNDNGTGVLVGVTEIANVVGYDLVKGRKEPREGRLYYRGLPLDTIVEGFRSEGRRGYEEVVFLLLFGSLPTEKELADFGDLLDHYRQLPDRFTENMILKIPSRDIMNKLQRSTLVLYSHDEDPENLSIENVLDQSLRLIARFPTIISYGYQAKAHYFDGKSLYLHAPKLGVGTAETILHMIRPHNGYSQKEAEILDLSLVLHAEHGGGNNSAFATHVVSSSGTDTYSAIAAAVGCLKGPKHGGANIRVRAQMADLRRTVGGRCDEGAIRAYLERVLAGEAFDGSGLIYGMGHAVYTLSDPRAVMLKEMARELAEEKGKEESFCFYESVERITKDLFEKGKKGAKTICANVDLYSGLAYEMLEIPEDLYTPLFAAARVAGWCAHRMEQIQSDPKILRPAYQAIHNEDMRYLPLKERVGP